MIFKPTQKGQALILIAFAAIGLFAFAALAIDGSRLYSEKRNAQNAADSAVLAAALAYTRNNALGDVGIADAAQTRATSNGYDNDSVTNEVVITVDDVPEGECPGGTDGKDITVYIHPYVDTTFARVIGRAKLETAATATSRACGFYYAPLFDGHAIVGLNPYDSDDKNCGFDTGQSNSAHWQVEGSGVFSNGCAHVKDDDAIEFDEEQCATTVGEAYNFGCEAQEDAEPYSWEYVLGIMPPNPCGSGGIGITPAAGQTTFTDGVYCITDFDDLDAEDIILDNATLYVTDLEFDLKFSGDGGFYGRPTEEDGYTGSEPYTDYYMIILPPTDPDDFCTKFNEGPQVIEWRGNGTGSFYGTILAPSICLDLRGNGDTDGMHSQIIAYTVSSNGNAGDDDSVYINYKQNENHEDPVYPSITILK